VDLKHREKEMPHIIMRLNCFFFNSKYWRCSSLSLSNFLTKNKKFGNSSKKNYARLQQPKRSKMNSIFSLFFFFLYFKGFWNVYLVNEFFFCWQLTRVSTTHANPLTRVDLLNFFHPFYPHLSLSLFSSVLIQSKK
jgi:hypothetical protein